MSWKDELEYLARQKGGVLHAEDVVAFASNPETELHKRFVWDDKKAGHLYRIQQARLLICTVKVIEGSNEKVRAFVSLSTDRKGEGGYRPLVSVINNDTQRLTMLADAKRDLESWSRRYERLRDVAEELSGVFDAIDTVASVRRDTSGDYMHAGVM